MPSLADAWLRLCPDPSAILGLEPGVAASPPDDPAGLLARRDAVLATTQEHYFNAPPRIERGWRHHLIDTRGRARVDIVNNVAVLGHSHPAVEAAVARQLRLLNTNSRFLYEPMVQFAEALAAASRRRSTRCSSSTPGRSRWSSRSASRGPRRGRRTCSRSAARTTAGPSRRMPSPPPCSTTRGHSRRGAWAHAVEAPNPLRGRFTGPDAGPRYAEDVRRVLAALEASGRGPAAFIAEALFGNAGGIVLPDGYLAEAYAAVRAAGGLAIADEVQVGYGGLARTAGRSSSSASCPTS